MKKKKDTSNQNYLEFIPERNASLTWKTDRKGMIVLDVENTGFFNRIAQKLFNRPEYTHVHLDKFGSFVWPLIDGQKNVIELGKEVDAHFGEEAAPLYERLAKHLQILESYHFIRLKEAPDNSNTTQQ